MLFLEKHIIDKPMNINRSLGGTLVELLVVLAILAILSSLALVGVQRIRESARNVSCKNRISQLGIALLNYESSNGSIPNAIWHAEAIRFMGLENVIEEMKSKEFDDQLEELLCPSDSASKPDDAIFANFLGNSGVWHTPKGKNGVLGCVEYTDPPIKLSDISDGVSNTSLFGEILTASTMQGRAARLRTVWFLPGQKYGFDEFDSLIAACLSIPPDPAASGFAGDSRLGAFYDINMQANVNGPGDSYYNHAAPPQSPSCSNGGSVAGTIVSSASSHPGTVNIVFCDGHTEGVSSNIDVQVWRKFGDRDSSNPY